MKGKINSKARGCIHDSIHSTIKGFQGKGVGSTCLRDSESFCSTSTRRGLRSELSKTSYILRAFSVYRTNQDTAFSGLMISYRIGQTIGLPIGGYLSRPSGGIFESPFWKEYPFALPCFVGAALTWCAVMAGTLLLVEVRSLCPFTCPIVKPTNFRIFNWQTLPRNVPNTKVVPHLDEGGNVIPDVLECPSPSTCGTPTTTTPPQHKSHHKKAKPSIRSVLTPHLISLLTSNLCMCLASEAMFVVYGLFAFTPIESGAFFLAL